MFAYCGNNPVSRSDSSGYFWNTIIGAVAGAIVGGITAAMMEKDIKAGIVSGAISGAISGAALDITIATGGVGLVALAAVSTASGVGGAVSSYVNQRMNGTDHTNIDWSSVVFDGLWGAIGGALSFGLADIGGATCKTVKQILSGSAKEIAKQAVVDLSFSLVVTGCTWLNSTKMSTMNDRSASAVAVH